MSQWQRVGAVPANPVHGTAVEFEFRGMPAFALFFGEDWRAYLNLCPHIGVELNWQPGVFMDIEKHFIQCSTHGALFVPDSGHCVAGPCQGQALTGLDIRVADNQLEVLVPEAS